MEERYRLTIDGGTENAFTKDYTKEEYEAKKDYINQNYQGRYKVDVVSDADTDAIDDNATYTVRIDDANFRKDYTGKELREKMDYLNANYADRFRVETARPVRSAREELGSFYAENGAFMQDFEQRDTLDKQDAVHNAVVNEGLSFFKPKSRVSDEERERYKELAAQKKALEKAWYTSDEYLGQKDMEAQLLSDMRKEVDKQRSEYAQANPVLKSEGAFQANPYATRGAEADAELDNYELASRIMDDTIKLHNAPSKYGANSGLKNMGVGALDKASDPSLWTMGLLKISDDLGVRGVLSKIQEKRGNLNDLSEEAIDGILTPAEKAVLKAWALNAQVQLDRQNDLSLGYQAGQSATESLMYMAEFALTGGVGKMASESVEGMAKWLAKNTYKLRGLTDDAAGAAVKAWGEKATKTAVGKYGAGLVKSLAETAGKTMVMPSTYKNIAEKATEIHKGEDGNMYLAEMNDAFAEGYVDSFIENLSEGGRVNALGELVGDVAGKIPVYKKLVDKFSHTKAGELLSMLNKTEVMNTLRAGGWHGFGEEYLEEWYGNALRSILGDPEALKNFATLDNQMVTLASFLPMSIFGGTVSTSQVLSAQRDLDKKAEALRSALLERGYSEPQADNMIDMMRGATPSEVSGVLSPVVEAVAGRDENEAKALARPAMEFAWAVRRYQSYGAKYNYQQQGQRDGLRAEMEQKLGKFWMEDENGRQTVQRGVNEKGEVVYLLGKQEVEDVQDGLSVAKEVAAINSEGKPVFVFPSDYQLAEELEMNDFLATEIMAEKGNQEQARKVQERETQIAEIKQKAVPGTSVNIGTTETPVMAQIVQRNADGVVAVTPDGLVRQIGYETLGKYLGVNTNVYSDAELDEQEADALSAERSQREAALDQEYENDAMAAEELAEAEEEIEQSVEAVSPLPTKEDGSVDQVALWNENPERWAQWNDEQRQDGGANSLAYVNGAIAKEQAKIAELQAAYEAESDFDTRDTIEKEIADTQARVERLTAIQQDYIAQAEAQTQSTQQQTAQPVQPTPQLTEEEKAALEEERRKPLRAKAKELSEKLGVKVKLAEDLSDVKESKAREQLLKSAVSNGKQKVAGWYNQATGEVTIFLPHAESVEDVEKTFIHEVVAHKGLRGLLGGEGFNVLCDAVWDMMSESDRNRFINYPGVNGDKRAAADEYVAHFAENLNLEEAKPDMWERIVAIIKQILESMGVRLRINQEGLSSVIAASYQKLLADAKTEQGTKPSGTGLSFRLIGGEEGAVLASAVNQKNLIFKQGQPIDFISVGNKIYAYENPYYNELIAYDNAEINVIFDAGIEDVRDFVEFTEYIKEIYGESDALEGVDAFIEEVWSRLGSDNRNMSDASSQRGGDGTNDILSEGTEGVASDNREGSAASGDTLGGTEANEVEEPTSPILAAAQQEGESIRFSITTEETLQDKIRKFAKTKDGKKTGWTEDQIESIIAETESLIDAIHKSSTGNEFYDEFAYKEPTIRVDWRDGEAKPIVTWTRANIEYKYDMSADLLCINNEGLEQVLSSDKMVALMETFIPEGKAKEGETQIKFTADDYLELYNTLRDLGFVVPCKGCFDAAGRFKMLPSVAQKFAAEVNAVIDERNKNPEAFDAKLRAKKGDKTATGLPTTASTKSDAIAVGVAGDNLTEHVKWTQLMSADGQTKMLSDWGGIFRAWQRTGAGRPKDKLLPEPYYGDIVSSVSTIIGKYGEKTPSFRDILVNQGTGLRRNSHSEFRPVLAIDEIQFMRDAFIRNLTVFKYMKELDDVRLFGKMGVKFNMSFFPEYVPGTKVAGLDKDGNYIASEESVGSREFPYQGEDGKRHYDGMKGWAEAQKYINKDVSLSSVIFSIPHLLKALTDVPTPSDMRGIWGSLIPFHSSGATTASLYMQGLGMARANGVGHGFNEAFSDYGKGVTNFEAVQNDRFGEGWYIVSGKKAGENVEPGHKLEFANGNHYYNQALGVHLFASGYILDSELPEGALAENGELNITDQQKKALMHNFTIDYNDKVRELKGPYAYKDAADYYISELPKLGLIPRFDFEVSEEKFLEMCEAANVDPRHPKLGWKGEGNSWSPIDSEAYYSLFCDYGMTDPSTGEWAPHMPVGYVNEEGKREFRLPENAVEIVKEGLDRFSEVRRSENARIDEAIEAFAERSVEKGRISQKSVDKVLGKKSAPKKSSKSKQSGVIDLVEEAKKAVAREDAKGNVSFRITPEMKEIKKQAEKDGTFMKAPNGQPTNLTEEQWLMVRTQNFKNWFGDWENDPENASKVVDENGEPKVVFHQTNQKIYVNRETGEIWDELGWKEKMEWDERDDWEDYWEEQDFNTFSRVNARTTNEFDGFFFAPEYDEYHEYGDRTIAAFVNIKNPASREDYNIDSRYNDAGRDERIRLQEAGFDGVIRMDGDNVDEYIAFEPNQIKSATDNNGDFNPNNNDIRFRITPEQDKAYMDAVEAGDMETAQRMVNEAARLAGYDSNSDYQGSLAFNGAAPSGYAYYDTKEERIEAWENGEYEDDQTLGDYKDAGIDISNLGWSLTSPVAQRMGNEYTRESIKNLAEAVNSDSRKIKVYRAVDADIKEDSVRNGDWVTPSRAYAEHHINLQDWKEGRIIEQEVDIDDIWWDGNDINEWGYNDGKGYAYKNTPNNRKLLAPVTYDDNGNVIPLSERFNEENEDIRFRVANENQAIFVSNAAKAVEGIKMEKATPEQWLKMIEKNGGLKAGEDKWMGLSDWLKASDKKTLTKQEVLDFINENMIQIEETHYDAYAEERASDAHSNIVGVLQNKFNDYVAEYHEEHGYEDEYDDPASKYAIEKLREEMEDTFPYTIELVYGNEVYVTFDYEEEDEMVKWAEKTGVDYMPEQSPINETRLQYTTDGLENKHEIALTVPTIERWGQHDDVHFGDAGDGRAVAWIRFGDTEITVEQSENTLELQEQYDKAAERFRAASKANFDLSKESDKAWKESGEISWTDSRMPEEWQARKREVVAELREARMELDRLAMALRNKEGDVVKKVLVLDEIQSKRHQEGREKGYFSAISSERLAEIESKYAEIEEKSAEFYAMLSEKYGAGYSDDLLSEEDKIAKEKIDAEFSQASDKYAEYFSPEMESGLLRVPDAPFDKNWHELAMKRMLRYAAENGYDVIAWTKGDQQAERYNIGGVISEIKATKYPRGYEVVSFGNNGNVVHNEVFADESAMAEVYGKEMSQRIIESVDALEPSETATISGDNLRVGGEGMKGFYDRILPAFMNKYGKKWGVKVEDIHLNLEGGLDMHSVPVTEEMKASVMEGQVMFRVRQENETPMEFEQSVLGDFKKEFNLPAPTTIVDVNDRDSLAAALGYTPEEFTDEMYNDILAGYEQGGFAFYERDTKRIAIFAREELRNGIMVNNIVFHENTHYLEDENPEILELGEWLWQNSEPELRRKIKEVILESGMYEGEEAYEMLAAYTGYVMSQGKADVAYEKTPSELQKHWELIFNAFGYEPRGKEIRRRGTGDNSGRVGSLRDRRDAEAEMPTQQSDIQDLTAEERRIIGEYFPEFNKSEEEVMKAPNGKDSKLTKDQWHLVRSEEFIDWFGDWINDPENASKVVDPETGEPMLVYHGTISNRFSEFNDEVRKNTKAPKGTYWFVSSEENAMTYAADKEGLYQCFLNLRNPAVIDVEGGAWYELPADYEVYDGEDVDEMFDTLDEAVAFAREHNIDESDIEPRGVTDTNAFVKRIKDKGRYDGAIIKNVIDAGDMAEDYSAEPATEYIVFTPDQIRFRTVNEKITSLDEKPSDLSSEDQDRNNKDNGTEENVRYRVVSDQETLDRLNSEPTIKVYRAMQLIDGKLYPPMSAKVDGELRQPIELGQWEEAEERPDLVDEKGRFKLDKGNKSSLKARYNPYFHTSPTPLNDQFSSAQTRPELVTVEVEVPESELTSGYKAEKAKDSVGKMEWKAGVIQSKLSGTRTVILSRWDKPVRIVPDSEVADVIVDMFEGRDITMPSNVVTPSLRAELEKRGVPFVETDNQGNPVEEVSFRVTGTPTDEVVANGLQLTPAQTAEVAANIFAALPEESRKKITDGLNGNILGLKDAILQIPTSLAIKENWNDEDKQMADVVAEEMTKMAGEMTRPFSAEEGLWLLYNNLNKGTDLISQASRALVQRNLGFDAETLAKQEQAKEDVRFRTVGDATSNAQASLYNRGAVNVWTRLKESYVDMMASVEELVKAIEKKTGKVAQGFENILLALNQQSSKGLAAMESYTQKFLNPMFNEIRRIMDDTKMKYEDIVRYVILKHGLERNKKLAQRDARAHYQEIYDDIIAKINSMDDRQKRTYLTNAQLKEADAKARLATLQAKDTTSLTDEELKAHKKELANARKEVKEAEEYRERAEKIRNLSEQEAQDELDKIFEKIENGTDSVYKEMRENDYSGISSMFYDQLGVDRKKFSTEEQYQAALMEAKKDRYSSLADVEAAAEAEVASFEGKTDTKELWKRINAATKETLRQQYEANMISKDQYDSLRNMFEYYVPLRGFKDNTAEDMYTYYRKPNSTGYTKPILGAEGRKTEAESPFGWIAAMAGSAIASNVKNEAKLALYYFVSNRPENGIATISRTWFVDSGEVDERGKKIFKPAYPPFSEDLSSDAAKASYEAWQENMRELQKKGQAYEAGQRLNLGNAVVNISDANKPEHIVNVKVGGKDYTIVINGNPRAAQAINGDLNIEGTAQDYSALFGPVLRWMSSVNTSYNPEFWITNMMRDMAFTMMAVNIKEDPAYRRKFSKNYRKAFKVISLAAKNENGTIGDSYLEEQYKDFVKYGGVTGYTQIKDSETWEKEIENYLSSNDPESIKNGKVMRGMKSAFHAAHRFGESLEQVSRFAAFLTARETGKSINEAINDAKEITVNFNRKGSGKMITLEEAKYLTGKNGQPLTKFQQWMVVGLSSIAPLGRRFIMFFNAAIQGLNATYKLMKKNPKRFTGWALGYAAVGMMNAVLHAMMDDDDDYLDIPDYERRNSLMIGGNGAYFKWALPQEARAFYALGDLAVEAVMGRTKHKKFLGQTFTGSGVIGDISRIITEILPVNPSEGWKAFVPSVAIPVVELMINEDYKGAPIYNEQKWLSKEEKERAAKWSSAYQGTGWTYVKIAQGLNFITGGDKYDAGFINLQPEKLEHLVQSAFGGTIRTADKFISTIAAAVDPEEPVTIRQTPFLNRFLTINDERFKNVHVNDVFDYYKADAEHALTLEKQYTKDRDMDALTELRSSDEYRWAKIYGKYKKPLKAIQEKIKVADGTAEKKELMKQQDELKKRMIKEISEL